MISKANKKDLKRLNEISYTAKKHWGYPDDWMERWLPELTITSEELVATDIYTFSENDKIIAFIGIEENDKNLEINHLWVIPPYINQGYGSQLLKIALEDADKKGKNIMVISDPFAESFYERFGFETYDQEPSYPEGRFLPRMIRKAKTWA